MLRLLAAPVRGPAALRIRHLLAAFALTTSFACSSSGALPAVDQTTDGAVTGSTVDASSDAPIAYDASTFDTGQGSGIADGALTVDAPSYPAQYACEHAYFASVFDQPIAAGGNGTSFSTLRESTFAHIVGSFESLQACGSKATLGGLLSLMVYVGDGAQAAYFDDRCSDDPIDSSSGCASSPSALYGYSYGMVPVSTSLFLPCSVGGVSIPSGSPMRARLATAIANAGFAPSPTAVAAVGDALHQVCPAATPTAVDYYILTAHSAFGVPKDSTGNEIDSVGEFPFFTPNVVVDLFFATLTGACATIDSDNDAIAIYGGGDGTFASSKTQGAILDGYADFKEASCP